MDSCKKNIPESNNMWYNAWKQTLYHRASGFHVHRENPGAQFSRKKQYYANKKGAAMNQYVGQPFAALRYEKKFWLLKKQHLLVDAAPSTRLLHVLRQPVFMTVRRGAFLLSKKR